MTRCIPIIAVLALSLSACSRAAPPMSDPLPPSPVTADVDLPTGACNADRARADAIGQIADATTVERARTQSGARVTRVIPPDTMVTMEYNEHRLNIDVDADNRITQLRCG